MKLTAKLSMLFLMILISSGCGLVRDANHTRVTIRQLEKDEKIGIAREQKEAEIGKAVESRKAAESKWNNISGIFSNGFFWSAVIAGMILFYKMFRFVIPVVIEFHSNSKRLESIPKNSTPIQQPGIIVENNHYFVVNTEGRRKQIDLNTARKLITKKEG